MKKIMNFVLFMLCLFSCNIAVNAATRENSVVQEIRNEKDRTDKEKLVVRKEEVDDGSVGEVSYYYKGNIHENDSQMREEDKEIRRFKLNFLGNRL